MIHHEVSLRLARVAEALEIARVSRVLIEHGLGWSWTPKRVAASIRSRQANVVVGYDASHLAGFGIMRYGDDEAHLDLLGVDVDYQHHGLGRGLMEWLEKPALTGGIATVVLEVRQQNRSAQAFYKSLGYSEVEVLEGYYQGRESAIRMRRELGVRF